MRLTAEGKLRGWARPLPAETLTRPPWGGDWVADDALTLHGWIVGRARDAPVADRAHAPRGGHHQDRQLPARRLPQADLPLPAPARGGSSAGNRCRGDQYAFWHKHFVGHQMPDHDIGPTDQQPYDCAGELQAAAPVVFRVAVQFWEILQDLVEHGTRGPAPR